MVTFEKHHESYADDLVRETLLGKIKHLGVLDEQILRSLKFPPKKIDLNDKAELEPKMDEEVEIQILDDDDFDD